MLETLLPEVVWADLDTAQRDSLLKVAQEAQATYADGLLGSGESAWVHAVGMAKLVRLNSGWM